MLYLVFCLAWKDSSQQIYTLGQTDPAVKRYSFSFPKRMADGMQTYIHYFCPTYIRFKNTWIMLLLWNTFWKIIISSHCLQIMNSQLHTTSVSLKGRGHWLLLTMKIFMWNRQGEYSTDFSPSHVMLVKLIHSEFIYLYILMWKIKQVKIL